jgi:hypothetical protein
MVLLEGQIQVAVVEVATLQLVAQTPMVLLAVLVL